MTEWGKKTKEQQESLYERINLKKEEIGIRTLNSIIGTRKLKDLTNK